MIVSMTGFGRSHVEFEDTSLTVEMKSVNHRFLEYHVRMPRQLFSIEDKIKKAIGEQVIRGRVEVFITLTGKGHASSKVSIDWPLLDEYFRSIKMIQETYKLEGEITLQDLLSREDFLTIDEDLSGNEELEAYVLSAAREAVKQLKEMRVAEGRMLEKDIQNQLTIISDKIHRVREYAPNVTRQYAERLKKRMEDFSIDSIDESRLVSEVAIFAEKADINEELTRLGSHISQFHETMKMDEPIGRKLDFILQEMNREVNTIGSKANDAHIAKEVVEMKSFLEKIKEQVQNIE